MSSEDSTRQSAEEVQGSSLAEPRLIRRNCSPADHHLGIAGPSPAETTRPGIEERCPRPATAAAQRPGLAVGSGLVVSVTSQTPWAGPFEFKEMNARRRLRRMRRGVVVAGDLHQAEVAPLRWRAAMLTLTYREDVSWSPAHVAALLDCARKWLRRRGHTLRYVWVMELTRRGVPHYHLVVWLPRGLTLPKPDKQGWWPHGSTRIEWARRPVGYLAKYASKGGDEHSLPKGARIFGCGGLSERARSTRRWKLLPKYVRDCCTDEDEVQRCPGGGWLSPVTGEWWPPWQTAVVDGLLYFAKEPPIAADPRGVGAEPLR